MTEIGITCYGCERDEATIFQEMAPHFGITPTITGAPISEATVGLAHGNRCISVDHKTQITPSMLHALGDAGVRYISTRSAGYNHIDIDVARSIGITVENVAYSPDSVADYTVMLMLMMARDITSGISRADAHDFRLSDRRGRELRDMTIGVVGTGHIGSAVIGRLRGFGGRILAYDHRPKTSVEYVSLNELLARSDIITLHTPLTTETHHLLDRQRIEQMKRGAFIINTGRGALLDTKALTEALERGSIGGAALDVLEGEEGIFYADFRGKIVQNALLLQLQKMPNVIITPHAAYYTDHALDDIVKNTIINCLNFEKENTV